MISIFVVAEFIFNFQLIILISTFILDPTFLYNVCFILIQEIIKIF
jgi:hypothetical protein